MTDPEKRTSFDITLEAILATNDVLAKTDATTTIDSAVERLDEAVMEYQE